MTTTVTIPARAFAAALKCAAKNDVRYYLNGVYLDFPKGRIVATTGHHMFIGKIEAATLPAVIVPRELVETALKSIKPRQRETMDFEVRILLDAVEPKPCVAIETHMGALFTAPAIDGRFPEYGRAVPDKVSGQVAQFNPDYIVDCAEALRLYTGQLKLMPEIQHNGDSASLMTQADCLCVCMPVRTGTVADADWYFKPVKLAAVA